MLITSCSWWPIFEKSLPFFSFSLLKMNLDEYVLCYASKYRVYFGDNIAKRLAISLLRFWTTICDFRPNNIIYFILFIYLFLRKNKILFIREEINTVIFSMLRMKYEDGEEFDIQTSKHNTQGEMLYSLTPTYRVRI